MSDEQLKEIWEKNFGQSPDGEILAMMTEYTIRSEENERVFLWILLKSSTQLFATENDRALWVGQQVKANNDGATLPALNDPMAA
jgi:hypothetical protein